MRTSAGRRYAEGFARFDLPWDRTMRSAAWSWSAHSCRRAGSGQGSIAAMDMRGRAFPFPQGGAGRDGCVSQRGLRTFDSEDDRWGGFRFRMRAGALIKRLKLLELLLKDGVWSAHEGWPSLRLNHAPDGRRGRPSIGNAPNYRNRAPICAARKPGSDIDARCACIRRRRYRSSDCLRWIRIMPTQHCCPA